MTKAKIYYYDIGDYLKREEKLAIVKKLGSVSSIPWQILHPNAHGDWLNQRNDLFANFIPLVPEKKFDAKSKSFFVIQGPGILTSRDTWVYNFATKDVKINISKMIDFYNAQTLNYSREKNSSTNIINIEEYINSDPTKISWTRSLKKDLERGIQHQFHANKITTGLYRPFCKQWLYYETAMIESPGPNQIFFPHNGLLNKLISIPGIGGTKDFSLILSNILTDYQVQFNNQCFPLYYYEERPKSSPTLFDGASESEYIRRDGVSDFILKRSQEQYGKNVSKEDIFYYVYGILHSPGYRKAFASDLKKMLPRIPLVEDVRDFWKFSKAGRQLAELHINYEQVPPYPGVQVQGEDSGHFLVDKMRFPAKDRKDTIIYNSRITISNIPPKAYEYVVNGKSAIEWIMERYQVKTDKASGIKNDPNDWSKEVGNPRYILDLLLSIINVSVQTVEIVEGLPGLRFEIS